MNDAAGNRGRSRAEILGHQGDEHRGKPQPATETAVLTST